MATFTGGYGSPIVMGLTPWSRTRIVPANLKSTWPPDLDYQRLLSYADFEALVENRATDVFDRLQLSADQKSKIVLAIALPELICNVWADAVWGDQPEIKLPGTAAQDAWDAIDESSEFSEIRGWESVFSAAFRGTSVVRLFRSEELGAITGSPVQIEEVDAGIFFPKLRKGSDRLIEYVVLAWEENRPTDDGKDQIWHVRAVHELVNGKYTITTTEKREKETDFRPISVETTSLDFLPFVDMHAKRWSGRYWGVSELSRSITLFDDIDNTLSNIAEILEYHGKPMLQVPFSSLFGGVLSKGADRTIGIRNHEEADVARYITYDGQLVAQLGDLDKVMELIFLTNEIPRTYFGLDMNSQAAPSGTSLRLQLQNYLKKASRWQRNETRRLKTVIDYALRIDGGFSDPKARLAEITHGSPLPADDAQEATIETALVTAGLSSKHTSIKRLRRVDDVDKELAEIDKEHAATVSANVAGLPLPMQAAAKAGLPPALQAANAARAAAAVVPGVPLVAPPSGNGPKGGAAANLQK